MVRSFLMLLLLLSFSSNLNAQKRHHSAHVHEVGVVNAALDKNALDIELTLPAPALLSFEHQPKNKQQESDLKTAITKLKAAAQNFTINPEAQCEVLSATANLHVLEEEDDKEEKDHHHHEHEKHEAEHTELKASYKFNCKMPKELKTVEVKLFDSFPPHFTLKGTVIGNAKELPHTLSKPNTTLKGFN